MKNNIFKCFIAALLAVVFTFTACINPNVVSADEPTAEQTVEAIGDYVATVTEQVAVDSGFVPVLKNDSYTLFYKAESAETAVYNRSQDEMFYSNPQDIDPELTGLGFHRLKSQLYVTYYVNNSQVKYYSSYFDSVSYGQNSAEIKDNKLVLKHMCSFHFRLQKSFLLT